MRKLLALILLLTCLKSFSQVSSNRTCLTGINLCEIPVGDTLTSEFDNCRYGTTSVLWYYIFIPYDPMIPNNRVYFMMPTEHIESYQVYRLSYATIYTNTLEDGCKEGTLITNNSFDPPEDTIDVNLGVLHGLYVIKLTLDTCAAEMTITQGVNNPDCPIDTLPCENCVGSFNPEPGRKYVISAWASQPQGLVYKKTFSKPKIYIDYTGETSAGPFTPSGQIIDDWQRIEGVFTIPAGADDISIRLQSDSADVYFDDIRIFPYDGSMKTYVFDPVTLRLVAELDERNYATIYEYDEEGKLIRVKKETERGVMTIQENRTAIRKE